DLENTEITGTGVSDLADLENLEELTVINSLVTDFHMREFKYLKKLNALLLSETQLTDAGFKRLREAGKLFALDLAQGKDGTRPTSNDEVLGFDLSGTKLSMTLLPELRDFKNLNDLHLSQTQFTHQTMRALHSAGILHAISRAVGKDGKRPTK